MNEHGPIEEGSVDSHGFRTIAMWQSASFLILLLLIWLNEILDLPPCSLAAGGATITCFGPILLSVLVVLTAVITVGQTYLKQKTILSGFVTVCAQCHKIRIRKRAWEAIEMYLAERCPVEFSHGLCPKCFTDEMAAIEARAEKKSAH